ncbi:MAG: ArsC family transcriptional regulator [Verrucomicrobiales bacterium]|nr:ArsC family transcriptional regulator [Verrucomicrobiales bacterium]
MKVYTYSKCSTCRKAVKWLSEKGIEFDEIPIREKPPTKAELKEMLKAYDGELRRLFNTSGQDYRALGLKDKLPGMSESEAITLLAGNGNLIKRPFLLGEGVGLVGFKEADWEEVLS